MTSNVTIKWNNAALRKTVEEAGREAMRIAGEAASGIRCLDHGDIVRVVERDPTTGEFKLAACCEPAKIVAMEAIRRAFA